ncbi:MAG: exosome complex protein Rrp42 [Candidatus Aenigmarchaeota archaeon]|nr:exosome complex protein Rrp42 [Candidatus Aenigmarchaeota archaeon]MBU5689013.1 exosome complex protein Rrp42 [Candidatus Aenigmarchaeota archaeon]
MLRANYILKLLEKNERIDGRKLDEFRQINIEKNIIEKAEGSARVKIGKTDVIAGIKMEIETPFPDTPNEGMLKTNAEFAPIAHPDFLPGPPSEDATELARVVDRGIRESNSIDLEKLCLVEGQKVWGVFIDIHIINHDGNLIDASSLASLIALMNTRIPKYEDEKIIRGEYIGKLPMLHTPINVTVSKILDKYVVDLTKEEEDVLDAWLSVAVREDGYICSMQKGGAKGLNVKNIDEMINLAAKKSKELRKLL